MPYKWPTLYDAFNVGDHLKIVVVRASGDKCDLLVRHEGGELYKLRARDSEEEGLH